MRREEEKRRASFSVFSSKSPRSSLSVSPRPSISKSARASFSRSPRGSTTAIDDALVNINWSPILGGSRYSVNRSSISRSSNASVKHDVIITIENAGKSFKPYHSKSFCGSHISAIHIVDCVSIVGTWCWISQGMLKNCCTKVVTS